MVESYLLIKKKLSVRCYNMAKQDKPLAMCKKRLYRTDEKLMCADDSGDYQFVMYDFDETQPYGRQLFLDPDMTMVDIDIMKGAQQKPFSYDKLFKSGGRIVLGIIVGAVLLWAGVNTIAGML